MPFLFLNSPIGGINGLLQPLPHMHIGQRIREELQERGESVVWLARQLSYSRTNIYKIFDKSTIDTGVLLRISIILQHDFFAEYSQEAKKQE